MCAEGFILGWLYFHSESHGASLGGSTFTLIFLARHAGDGSGEDWVCVCVGGEGFIFRLALPPL